MVFEKVTYTSRENGKTEVKYCVIFTSDNAVEALKFLEKQEWNCRNKYIKGREYKYKLLSVPNKGGETMIGFDYY